MAKRGATDDDDDAPEQPWRHGDQIDCMEGVVSTYKRTMDDSGESRKRTDHVDATDEPRMFSRDEACAIIWAELAAQEHRLRVEYTTALDTCAADMYAQFIRHQRDATDPADDGINAYVS